MSKYLPEHEKPLGSMCNYYYHTTNFSIYILSQIKSSTTKYTVFIIYSLDSELIKMFCEQINGKLGTSGKVLVIITR